MLIIASKGIALHAGPSDASLVLLLRVLTTAIIPVNASRGVAIVQA